MTIPASVAYCNESQQTNRGSARPIEGVRLGVGEGNASAEHYRRFLTGDVIERPYAPAVAEQNA